MQIINTIVGIPLGYLMWLCYQLLTNYGLAILLFTLLTKVLLFPLSVWVQKNSIKMVKLQPQVNEITIQHMGNPEKASQEQMALYKREGYRPLAGLIPMLIQIPIILGLISVMYNPLQHLLHLNSDVITALVAKATELAGMELGSGSQLKVIELVRNAATLPAFQSIQLSGVDMQGVLTSIQQMDLNFLGFDLAHVPALSQPDIYWLFPLLSGLSALLLCVLQNRENVLQREQGFLGRWGTTIFLTLFSTYFAFLVPAGVGFYWILGNLFSCIILYLLNWMYNPKKYIDYEALEETKQQLAESKKLEKASKPTKEQMDRAKEDYKRFLDTPNKQLVFYSEKSGFYKYFGDIIDEVLKTSDITIHYVTSDPKDAIFQKNNPRILPYFIDDNRLIVLFMKLETDVMVMTTPDLQTYHLKRSLVRKDVEYVYTPHDCVSVHMGTQPGSFDHFDTIFVAGPPQERELRAQERVYDLKPRNLVPTGYVQVDKLTRDYEALGQVENQPKRILIAPSWQEGNLLDGPVHSILEALLPEGYDITVRPHPEYLKRYPGKMNAVVAKYQDKVSDTFRFDMDLASNDSTLRSDLLITDWSGIALEFSYATKKPSLFINTPQKILNKEYEKIECPPVELTLRNELGVSLEEDELSQVGGTIGMLFREADFYKDKIQKVIDTHLYFPGHAREHAATYLVGAVEGKKKQLVTDAEITSKEYS